MRILVTVPWGEPLGGAEAMLGAALTGSREEGHELDLVFFEDGSWPAMLRDAGFRVAVIPVGRLREARRFAGAVLRLARAMRSRRPDLILNWAAKTQLYGAPAALLAGMSGRVVWWQHSIPERNWLDLCATALPARAIGCTSCTAARAQARLCPVRPTFVVAAGVAPPAAVSSPAPGAALPSDTVPIFSHAVPHPASLELPTDVPIVGLVGRLQPWKGQDRLLRAQALLRERGHRMHTVLVGGDAYGLASEYAASIPGLVRELGLEGEVTLTGQVPDAGPYIERFDVLVNASDPEPFGIVLLEGMARGVAVLAVDAGGPAEIVEHGRTGVLARSGEPEVLADALEPLLESATRRREIGAAGRERFMREFTDAAMRRRFFGALQQVADGAGGA